MDDLYDLERAVEEECGDIIKFTRRCLTLISRTAIRAAHSSYEEDILDTLAELTSALTRSELADFWWNWDELECLHKRLTALDSASKPLTAEIALKYRIQTSWALIPANYGRMSEKERDLVMNKRCVILVSRIADRGACSRIGLHVIDTLAELDYALERHDPRPVSQRPWWRGGRELQRSHRELAEIDGTSDGLRADSILRYAFGMTWN